MKQLFQNLAKLNLYALLLIVMLPACEKEMPHSLTEESAMMFQNHHLNLQMNSLPGGKRLFGYFGRGDKMYSEYMDSIDGSLLTDIALIGEIYDSQGNLPITPGITAAIAKAHAKGLRMFICIGGGASYSASLLEPQNRSAFIHNLVKYLVDHNYEGIDLDYEGAQITANFSPFVVELSDSLRIYNKLLSMAIARYQGNSVSQAAYDRLDFLNPMIYDYTTPSTPQPHASLAQFQSDVDFFLTKVPAAKINAGVPAYTWAYVNGQRAPSNSFIPYRVVIQMNANNAFQNRIQPAANEQWFYDGHPVVKQKVAYALGKNLGGMMIFDALSDSKDDRTSLLKLIKYCFANPNGFNPVDRYSLINVATGKAMLISGASTANGAPAIQGPGNLQNSHLWNITFVNGSNFGIVNVNSAKALDVTGASMADNAPLAQWPWWNQAQNQLYTLKPNTFGYYTINVVHSNKALEVQGWSMNDGTPIVQKTPNGGVGQQWVLIKQ